MSETVFDLVVIGSGPGGYVGAIRAAQLGLNVAVVEKDATFGGTCLNVGCIPSKALLDSSEHYSTLKHEFKDHGIEVGKVKLNLKEMMNRKNKVVSDLTTGVAYLFEKNNIKTFKGFGTLLSPNQVEVKTPKENIILEARNIMLATGSVANSIPGIEINEKDIVSSTGAIALTSIPKKMVVIGAGAIGLEMASVWSRLGTEVTLLEYANKIAGTSDTSMSKRMLSILKKQGMKFELNVKVTGAKSLKGKVEVSFESLKDGKTSTLDCDICLVATGRKPFSTNLGLENLGIEADKRGFVPVNDHFQTAQANVYAIGDLIPGPMLAHVAEEEGVAVAEYIATGYGHVNYQTVPWVIYTWPELASVGASEDDLKAAGIEYKSGSFPFSANGRARAMNSTDGMVKVLADKNTDQLLGVHILGPRASDIISEAVVAMEFGGSAEDLARSFHAHPTLPEAIREAALAVNKAARQS